MNLSKLRDVTRMRNILRAQQQGNKKDKNADPNEIPTGLPQKSKQEIEAMERAQERDGKKKRDFKGEALRAKEMSIKKIVARATKVA